MLCANAHAYVGGAFVEDLLWDIFFFFLSCGFQRQKTQAVRLGGKHPDTLSHPASLQIRFQ